LFFQLLNSFESLSVPNSNRAPAGTKIVGEVSDEQKVWVFEKILPPLNHASIIIIIKGALLVLYSHGAALILSPAAGVLLKQGGSRRGQWSR
jgi:hypothetical protein